MPCYGCSKKTFSKDKNKLFIHYIDVGQGDSILIQVNNKNLLIDAGPNEATKEVVAYLKKMQVKKLDYIVTTHPHEDHIGGMSKVIKSFDIGCFYAPKKTMNTTTFSNMASALKRKNLKINVAKSGILLDMGNDIICEFLSPNNNSYNDINNYSATIKITYGNNKFLFMGDAEKLVEKEILNKGYDVSCDVVKVGHHGSTSSSSKEFLNKANPKYVVISCGKGNKYGHPHKETLSELKKRNIQLRRTDLNGTVVFSSDGNKISEIK